MKTDREIKILFRRLRLYDQLGRRAEGLVRTIQRAMRERYGNPRTIEMARREGGQLATDHRDGLCTVIPLSGDEPEHQVDYVTRVEFAEALPYPFPHKVFWAKCDMIATVSFERLDLFHTDRDQYGKRRYLHPKMSTDDVARVRACVLKAIGL